MSMHLMKVRVIEKSPKKFASAAAARKSRELKQMWEEKQKEWAAMSKPVKKRVTTMAQYTPKIPPGRETPRVESLDTGWTACTKKDDVMYSGTKMLGVGVMHKSCLQPVFNQEQANDLAKMRR